MLPSPFIVYGLVDPRTGAVRYIGRSSRGLARPKAHTYPRTLARDRTHKGAWLRSLGRPPDVKVLASLAVSSSLPQVEREWIALGRALGWPLTNLADGGHGGAPGVKQSVDWIEKRMKHLRGRPLSAQHREALSVARTGSRASEQTRATLRRRRPAMLGRKHSPETIAKMRAAKVGKRHTEATKQKIRAIRTGTRDRPETVAKKREAQIARWARLKAEV